MPIALRPTRAKWLAAARGFYLCLGLALVALGFVGIFLPVLPTTPFLILAAACFARSSKRLEVWLLSQPRFGPLLKSWRERGAIPLKAKWMSLGGCVIGFALFLQSGAASWPLGLLTAAVMLSGLLYVFTRPNS